MCMARHAGRECRAEIIVRNGRVAGIEFGNVAGKRPLEGQKLKDFETLVRAKADEIVERWINFFVHNVRSKPEIINAADQMKAVAKQYLEVTEAKYVSGYKLLLTFNDGEVRVVDFGPFLEKARNPDTTDYRDLKKFKSFRIEYGDLIWGDHQMIFPIMDLYRGSNSQGQRICSGVLSI